MKELTIQSKSGATIKMQCEHKRNDNFRYTATISGAGLTLHSEKPWYWGEEQGQKILVLGFQNSQRQATTVTAAEEQRINEFIAACREGQKMEKQKMYQPLIDQLPERAFETAGNDEKAQELLEKAAKIKDVKGSEMDGVNMQQSMKRQALRTKAQKHCSHDLEERYHYTFTADARRKVLREITCEKCDLVKGDEVSEELSEEAIWQ